MSHAVCDSDTNVINVEDPPLLPSYPAASARHPTHVSQLYGQTLFLGRSSRLDGRDRLRGLISALSGSGSLLIEID